MKTTFSRQFVMITVLLLVCMLITGVSFRFLMLNSIETEQRGTLQSDAAAVANLAKAYDSAGELEDNWDFRMSLSFISSVGSAEAVVCDLSGKVLLCSCDEFTCEHIGQSLPESFRSEILANGTAFEASVLENIYTEKRFIAGASIISDTTSEPIGFVVVSSPMTQISQFMLRSSTLFLYAALVVLVLSLIAATFLSRSQVKPLKQVADAARNFGRGDLSARVQISPRNTQEIIDLAQAFNSMADSLEKSEQRRNEFIANVSHELKTPMTTIGGFIDGMLDGTIPPEKHRYYMQTVSNEVRRLSRLVRNMLDISRLQAQGIDEARKTRFDVGEAMGDVLISFEQKINAKHLQVNVDLPDRPVWTKADREGWGLGLYIAKTIIGAHGEDIRASSENGLTQFRFTLPIVR